MKANEAVKLWESGVTTIRGIYHGGAAKAQMVRSQQAGGARREAVVTRETVLTDQDAVVMSAWMPDGSTVDSFKPACKKGQPCIIIVEDMATENGSRIIKRGRIEPLES